MVLKRIVRIFVLVFAVLSFSHAQLTGAVGGTINATNNKWGPGRVDITADITVPANVTLTINAGTTIHGYHGINIEGGTLAINGVDGNPVRFIDGWMYFLGGTHTLNFFHMFTWGETAIDINGATINFNHLQLQNFSKTGLLVRGATGKVNIDFSTIGTMAKIFTGDNVAAEGVAVRIEAAAANNKSSIRNSVLGFQHNASNTGLYLGGATSNHTLAYNYISGPRSNFNTTDTIGIYRGEPKVTDIPNLNHNLDYGSPAIDLADPKADFSKEPQPNGGRANLGYHGGTSQARPLTAEVISPNGCEEKQAGVADSIFWVTSRYIGTKTLSLSTDNGASWTQIAKITDDNGKMAYTWPAATTNQALVKIALDSDPTRVVDVSNRPFSIGATTKNAACSPAPRCPTGTTGCKYFSAICYTGYRDKQQPSGEEPTYAQVREDLGILSQYTHGIRTYGSDPNMHNGKYVPKLADSLGLNLHLGIWIDESYSDAVNKTAIDNALAIVAQNHPSIKSLIVGNEYMLRARKAYEDIPKVESRLAGYIKYAKDRVPASVKVMNGESNPDWITAGAELMNAPDVIAWHVHPWWEQKPAKLGVYQVEHAHIAIKARMAQLGISKPMVLAETGYPSGACSGTSGCGSPDNQARYLQDLNDYSMLTGIEYWFFEGFDEPWKAGEGPVGDQWAMWYVDRKPKKVISQIATYISATEMWPKNYVSSINNNQKNIQMSVLDAIGYWDKVEFYSMTGAYLGEINQHVRTLTELHQQMQGFPRGLLMARFYRDNKVLANLSLAKP